MIVNYIWAFIIGGIIIADVFLLIFRKRTWSEVTKIWNTGNVPMTGFAVFYLAAHLVLPNFTGIPNWVGVLGVLVFCGLVELIQELIKRPFPKWAQIVNAFSGLVLGWILWAQ